MKYQGNLLRSGHIFTICALLLTSIASGSVHAQTSCKAYGPVRHHLTFDQTNQVQGTGLVKASGIKGHSLRLNAKSQAYINTLPIGGPSNQLTFGVWVRPDNVSGKEARFISRARGTKNIDHDFMVSSFNKTGLRFRLRIGDTTHTIISGNGVLKVLKWNHIAVTYSGQKMVLYHNGKSVASKNIRGSINMRAALTGIGNQPPGSGDRPYAGKLDEMVILDRALTAAEVSGLATQRGLACSNVFAQISTTQQGNTPFAAASPPPPQAPAQQAAPVPQAAAAQQAAPVQQAFVQAQAANTPPSSNNLPVFTGNNWPSNNDQLPMGGIFYGTPKAGMTTGNAPIAAQNAIRFRAQRSGFIKAVRYHNRTLSRSDIDKRCAQSGRGSVWCNCKNAGLDELSCGYTLSNSYNVGTGGSITLEIRENDNSARNLPGSRVLGTSNSFTPIGLRKKFPTINLNQRVRVEAGKIYHIVFRNDKAPTNCRLRGLTVAQAKRCDRSRGAISINGTQHATDPSSLHPFGPFLGTAGSGTLARSSTSAQWKFRDGVAPFYEVQYTDGTYIGDTYAGFDNTNYAASKGTRDVEGAKMARQVFKVTDADRKVNGLWLNYGHSFLKKANGAPLKVTLKAGNGTTLATGSISTSKSCSDIATEASKGRKPRETRLDWMCRTWGYTNLSKVVNLAQGKTYSVEFSAPNGAAFVLSTYFSSNGLPEVNIWQNAQADRSTNSGRTWTEWSGTRQQPTRDIPMLFTLEGMPKQLP